MQTPVPMEWEEGGWGLELVALAVHSRFVEVVVPRMWEFAPHTTVLSKSWLEPAAVVQVVHRKLSLQTETSFQHSPKLGFGKQH